MNNPNTHPAPAVIADLRTGLDAAKRLREHLTGDAPELQQADETIAALETAIDAADIVPTPDPGGMIVAYHAAIEELATLRADNAALKAKWEAGHVEAMETRIALNQEVAQCDELRADNAARGVLIEQLRAARDAALNERDTYRRDADKLESVRRDRDKYFEAWRRTLRALNAVVNATAGEP